MNNDRDDNALIADATSNELRLARSDILIVPPVGFAEAYPSTTAIVTYLHGTAYVDFILTDGPDGWHCPLDSMENVRELAVMCGKMPGPFRREFELALEQVPRETEP